MMRRTGLGCLLLAGLLLSATGAQAHTRQGTVVLQGTIQFSSSSGDLYGDDNRTQLTVAPAVHYFVIDQLAVGGRLGIESVDQGDFSSSSFLLGPSAAYYFGLDNQTIPYLGAAVLFRSVGSEQPGPGGTTIDSDESGTSIAISAGLAHFFREHLAITPELSINLESLGGESGTTILLGVGLAGFLY